MSSSDGPGADPEGLGQASGIGEQVHSQLVEALILLLIEKGVLTKNDALSIVQSVAQVQKGAATAESTEGTRLALQLLQRLYLSFDALSDRSGMAVANGENVLHLGRRSMRAAPNFRATIELVAARAPLSRVEVQIAPVEITRRRKPFPVPDHDRF